MNYQTLELATTGPVATVALNRPEVFNAFNESAIEELANCFRVLGNRDELRVIVLAARGKCFSAGADLDWMRRMAELSYQANFDDAYRLATMLRTIYLCPKPVIARVQGDAFGGGVGLIAASDIAVAVESASFSLSEVKLGLIPATISPYVIRAIGARAARRYFVTAERFAAVEAHRIGLVHAVVTVDQLDSTIQSVIAAISQNGPLAVTKTKELIHDIDGRLFSEEVLRDTAERIAHIRASSEAREGVRAFLEKRSPAWHKNGPGSMDPDSRRTN
ncbi:MAG TPA: enoyl-CoA hydratase/isomerase family protein [Chthoniobacterales bacterium]|nr:enoyl-CoA hydratase/isomerase family protein [Chthoniobacterales bacterium]